MCVRVRVCECVLYTEILFLRHHFVVVEQQDGGSLAAAHLGVKFHSSAPFRQTRSKLKSRPPSVRAARTQVCDLTSSPGCVSLSVPQSQEYCTLCSSIISLCALACVQSQK